MDDSHNSKEVIVKRNPKFISPSKKITINEGDTIKLPCTVDNLDSLVIIWKKGKNIISVGNNFMNVNDKRYVRTLVFLSLVTFLYFVSEMSKY